MQPLFRRLWSCYDFCYFLKLIVNQEINKKDLMTNEKKIEAEKGKLQHYTYPWQQILFYIFFLLKNEFNQLITS